MKKVLIIIVLGIFMLGLVSAMEWDNILNYKEAENKITVRNALGLPNWLGGSTLIEATLDENRCGYGGRFCEAIKTITINGEMELVQDFRTLKNNKDGEEVNIRWYKFEYLGEINDYELQCTNGKDYGNGTIEKVCNNIEVGSHQGWIQFYEGDVFQVGTYQVRTSGEIKPGKVYDWQIKFAGKWTTPWATWGNITLGDDAEILLNSPTDNFLTPGAIVTFNCSANVTGGATLINMSLYTNESGTFEIKNSTFFDVGSLGLISYYKFDGATGLNALDSIGVNNGTISGVTRNVTGIINKSFDFESSDPDFVDLNAVIIPTGASANFAISAWVNPESFNGTQTGIIHQNSGGAGRLFVDLDGAGKPRIFIGGTSFLSLAPIGIDVWSHILVKREGTNVSLWINGQHNGSMSKGDGIDATDTQIGRISLIQGYFDGEIDEVGFWNRSITATEILEIYNTGSAARPGSPTESTQTWNRTITETTLWTCQGCDSDGDCGFATTNRTVLVDTTAPTIDAEAPIGILNFNSLGSNETLNVTFTDTGLDTCWFDYNGTNITIEGCESGVKNSTTFKLEEDNFNMKLYANDTIGNENSTFINWSYNLFANSIGFSETTTSGAMENFTINITFAENFTGISMLLNYNGTNHTMTSSDINNTREYSVELVVPSVAVDTNITLFFIGLLSEGVNITQINTPETNQTVSPFLIDDCSVFTEVLLSFEMVDEDSLVEINGTIEFTVEIFSLGTTDLVNSFNASFDYVIGDASEVCLDNITESYSMSYQIRHFGDETQYFKKYRNVQFMTINNGTIPQNITLFNLNLTRGQSFNVIVVGNLLSAAGNAGLLVDTQRQYLSLDQFISVESPVTDSSGVAIANLVETEEVYNFLVSFNGELLGTFNNFQVKCANAALGQCSITLNLASATGTQPDFETVGNITQVFLLDTSTNILHHSFISTDGESKTITSLVIKDDGFGNTTICNGSASGTSGTILCPIPTQFQNVSIFVQTFESNTLLGSKYFSQGPDTDWQGADILIILLMFSSLVLLFVAHPIALIIGSMLGLTMPVLLIAVAGASFGSIVGAVLFYIAAGIVAIIVIGRKTP